MTNAQTPATSQTSEAPESRSVVPFPGGRTTLLSDAVRRLVDLKQTADILAGGHARSLMDPALGAAPAASLDSMDFLGRAIPFLSVTGEVTHHGPVPVDSLFGESGRWRPEDVPVHDIRRLLDYFTDAQRAGPLDRDGAEVFAWPDLGLYVAHEGKNRVAFLRAHGVTAMPAAVLSSSYPAAERIRRYMVQTDTGTQVWAVLDGRYAQLLPLHRLGAKLLDAYGVPPVAAWPDDLPPPAEVSAGLRDQGWRGRARIREPSWPRCIDLKGLAAPKRQKRTNQSALDALGARLRLRAMYLWGAATLLGMLLGTSSANNIVVDAGWASYGLGVGGLLMLTLPMFRPSNQD